MSDTQQPIGVFDSGVGGLTIAHAISEYLPNEQIIYMGDTAHLPYGDKSPETILQYVIEIGKFLKSKRCKLIVIACNSASAVAYNILKQQLDIPVIDVIRPTVMHCIQKGYQNIGVIGTKATVRSNLYESLLLKEDPNITVASLATPLLVPMIEEGFFNSSISNQILSAYVSYPDFQSIDSLILGCTHYPLIKEEISGLLGDQVNCIDATEVIPKLVADLLGEQNLLSDQKAHEHRFYVSDMTESFKQAAQTFYGERITLNKISL